ncbi:MULTISPECIES: hypothetical protein [Rhizobium]|uniref:Uncharacterized protein n=1 Tax=Rhizobium phaseoli TaxID=396 RepID=A0A7X6IYQ3_9HYPH|nr:MULTISPECIES: hypothetical protein [Rhizobium]MDE8757569.1 hypothetical protein [Rhizobium sp. CBK13]NKF11332.1 hypothetical protein [Rhizobium phaseoli]QPK12580.1 hypothetical protein HER27_031845 [Rhizobium phaseoli]
MAKLHQKIRDITECYLRIRERQAPETEPANLKLSAMSCRNGRILTVKRQTTKDAILTVDFEDGDRDHQVAGKLKGVRLGEDEIVRHVERLHQERANSRSMAPKRPGAGRDHRDGAARAAAAC